MSNRRRPGTWMGKPVRYAFSHVPQSPGYRIPRSQRAPRSGPSPAAPPPFSIRIPSALLRRTSPRGRGRGAGDQ